VKVISLYPSSSFFSFTLNFTAEHAENAKASESSAWIETVFLIIIVGIFAVLFAVFLIIKISDFLENKSLIQINADEDR